MGINEKSYALTLLQNRRGLFINVDTQPPSYMVIRHDCKICNKVFTQRSKMEGHIFYEHAFQSIYCTGCSLDCKLSSINEHLLCEGSTKKTFKMNSVNFLYTLRKGEKYPTLVVGVLKGLPITRLPVCELCSRTFSAFELFTYHVATHHNVEKFQCPTCRRSLIFDFESLQSHVFSKHRDMDNQLILNLVFKPFSLPDTELKGLNVLCSLLVKLESRNIFTVSISKRKDNLIVSKCNICDFDFAKTENLFYHINYSHEKCKSYTCTSCLTNCQIDSLQEHICNDKLERTFRSGRRQYSILKLPFDQLYVKIEELNFFQHDNYCFVCKLKTGVEGHYSLRRHLKSKHNIKFFQCDHCSELVSFEKFEEHILSKHNALEKVVCSRMLCFKSNPEIHCTYFSLIKFDGLRLVVNNENKIEYDCTLCNCKFDEKTTFQNHLGTTHRIHHLKCILCNVTISFSRIEEHIASQHDCFDTSALFLCVDSAGSKIESHLKKTVSFLCDNANSKVVHVKFMETSAYLEGK